MTSHRVRLSIPSSVKQIAEVETFARQVASTLMDGMAQTFGAIERKNERIVWTAHEWQQDGTFVCLSVDPIERSIALFLDTRGLERPEPSQARWTWSLIGFILVIGVVAGIWRGSILLGVVLWVAGFGSWIGVDVGRRVMAERRRRIDTDWWNGHLEACVRNASST